MNAAINLYSQWNLLMHGKNYYRRHIDNHTYLERSEIEPRDISMVLHKTKVVSAYENGMITLRAGGYYTETTKDRINQALAGLGTWLATDKNNFWWIRVLNGATLDLNNSTDYLFYESISFVPGADGVLVCTDHPCIAAERKVVFTADLVWLKKIRGYVREINNEDITSTVQAVFRQELDAWEVESLGVFTDCIYCIVDPDTDMPFGDAIKNHSHLKHHIDEMQVEGSLIVNALNEYGYPIEKQRELITCWQISDAAAIRKAVRVYLERRLITSAHQINQGHYKVPFEQTKQESVTA